MNESGEVYLVGAGPGDEGLLTVRGRALLEQAQVVVYDRLVGDGILENIPQQAERIDVGKHMGNHPVPQEEINRILVEQAQLGKMVVRLKGGDSFLFGRGGEELEYLYQHQIPFQVVPGVTSALAGPAYAGIPVTHRDYCSSVHIITGHKRKNGALVLDYEALARLKGTLVFLMSVSSVGEIAQGLLKQGVPGDIPCAVVENATRPQQRKFLSSLADLEQCVRRHEVQSPAILVVGKVCQLSQRLDWFGRLPLKGRRILVTSPKERASRLAVGLTALGAQVTQLPAIRCEALSFALPALSRYTGLVFTSATGVRVTFERLFQQGLDARCLYGKRIAVVGKETAKTLRSYGIQADFIPTEYSGEALGREMIAQGWAGPRDRLLLLRAKDASRELPHLLQARQIPFDELAIYETIYEAEKKISPSDFDLITFTSASCVEGLVRAMRPGDSLSGLHALCIGKQTAKAAEQYGMRVSLPSEATIAAMIEWIGGMQNDSSRTQTAQ